MIRKLWDQFGFWHWILAPLAVLNVVLFGVYQFLLAHNLAAGWQHDIWLAANGGMVVFLAILALAIIRRFKGWEFDNRFDQRIFDHSNRNWFISGFLYLFAFGMMFSVFLFPDGSLYRDLATALSLIIAMPMICAALGINFYSRMVFYELWMRTFFGRNFYSDEYLERVTTLRHVLLVQAPLGILFGLGFFAAIGTMAYFFA